MNVEQKRRELFESKYPLPEGMFWCEILNQYSGHKLWWLYGDRFEVFNAALDGIEIEFVGEYEVTDTGEHAQQVALVANCMLDDCRAAIESTGLGLKVKP